MTPRASDRTEAGALLRLRARTIWYVPPGYSWGIVGSTCAEHAGTVGGAP